MMSITQQKVLKVAARAQQLKHKALDHKGEVVAALALRGFKSFARVDSPLDDAKLELDLDYHEVSKDPESLKSFLDEWQRQIKRWCNRQDWISKIQETHKVSGLTLEEKTLGSQKVDRLWQHDLLCLIDEDLPLMREQKELLFTLWLDYSICSGLDFYVYKDFGKYQAWELTSLLEINAALPFYDWVNFWESILYQSPSMMKEEGRSYLRDNPQAPDDERRHEVHLVLGSGIDTVSPKSSMWFCACNKIPLL